MKRTFIETPVFTELITDLLENEDYQRMQEYLLIYPTLVTSLSVRRDAESSVGEFLAEQAARAAECE